MTHLPTGDRGQRYEVRYTDDNGEEKVFGWSESLQGAMSFRRAIKLHPTMHLPVIIDRRPGDPPGKRGVPGIKSRA